MKIAICSLFQFTHVAELIDLAEALAQEHEVCYFLGFYCLKSVKLLEERKINYQILGNKSTKVSSVLPNPDTILLASDLFLKYFIKYAEITLPLLLKYLKQWKPDLILSHLRDYSGIIAAEILELPVVSFGSHTSPVRIKGIDPPFASGISCNSPPEIINFMWRLYHRFNEKIAPYFNQKIRYPYGLSEISKVSTLHSPQLVLLSLFPALSNKNSLEPDYIKYVGSLFSKKTKDKDVREKEVKLQATIAKTPKPRIFVSLGTTYIKLLLEKCLQTLTNFSGTIIVSLGNTNDLNLNLFPDKFNFIYHDFFEDVDKIIELSDLVITVGGGKTVLDTLIHGKPLFCLPQQGEQQEIAFALKSLGVAEMIPQGKWNSEKFIDKIKLITKNFYYSQNALKIQKEIKSKYNNNIETIIKLIENIVI
jgi:UDP:flavonoid glycosyltransferase YjiC (YdhE family)